MKNFVQKGRTLMLLAAVAVASGGAMLTGKIFGVAVADVKAGEKGEFETEGVFELPVLATDVVAQGAILYWDDANDRLTTTAGALTRVGVATEAKAAGVATVMIKIDAVIG